MILCALLILSSQELRTLWNSAADNESWRDLFFLFGLDVEFKDDPEDEPDSSGEHYERREEPKETKKKKKKESKHKHETKEKMKEPGKAYKDKKRSKKDDAAAKVREREEDNDKGLKGKKRKTKAAEETETTPKKKSTKQKAGSPVSTEKHPMRKGKGKPVSVQECRPAAFGRKKVKENTLLAKPGQAVAYSPDHREADEFEVGEEDHELDLGCPRIARKSHKRCKKAVLSEHEVKMATVRKYLGRIGATWPQF